jgi:hypothetical protein
VCGEDEHRRIAMSVTDATSEKCQKGMTKREYQDAVHLGALIGAFFGTMALLALSGKAAWWVGVLGVMGFASACVLARYTILEARKGIRDD